jgi:hypothetical protein
VTATSEINELSRLLIAHFLLSPLFAIELASLIFMIGKQNAILPFNTTKALNLCRKNYNISFKKFSDKSFMQLKLFSAFENCLSIISKS